MKVKKCTHNEFQQNQCFYCTETNQEIGPNFLAANEIANVKKDEYVTRRKQQYINQRVNGKYKTQSFK